MFENHVAVGVEHESDVEEPVLPIRMVRLGLRHNKRLVLASDGSERVGLRAGYVDGAFTRKHGVIEVEYLVVEALQRALGQRDEAHRQLEAREPGGGLDQVFDVLEVRRDIIALSYSADCRNQPDGGVRLDHTSPVSLSTRVSANHRKFSQGGLYRLTGIR